eukprot:g2531.t1
MSSSADVSGEWFSIERSSGTPNGDRYEFRREGERYYVIRPPGGAKKEGDYFTFDGRTGQHAHGPTNTLLPNGDLWWDIDGGKWVSRRVDSASRSSSSSASGSNGKWSKHVNIDMCGQGDVEIIQNWRSTHSIDDLKKIVEAKGYSAVCVGSFGHAALKKFSFQLTPGHCKPSKGYTNELHIYHNAGASKPNDVYKIKGSGITSLDAWVGQKGESFPIGQPAKIVETFDFTREGEIYVTTGSSMAKRLRQHCSRTESSRGVTGMAVAYAVEVWGALRVVTENGANM